MTKSEIRTDVKMCGFADVEMCEEKLEMKSVTIVTLYRVSKVT